MPADRQRRGRRGVRAGGEIPAARAIAAGALTGRGSTTRATISRPPTTGPSPARRSRPKARSISSMRSSALDGVDMVCFGPNDLSVALTGRLDIWAPEVKEAHDSGSEQMPRDVCDGVDFRQRRRLCQAAAWRKAGTWSRSAPTPAGSPRPPPKSKLLPRATLRLTLELALCQDEVKRVGGPSMRFIQGLMIFLRSGFAPARPRPPVRGLGQGASHPRSIRHIPTAPAITPRPTGTTTAALRGDQAVLLSQALFHDGAGAEPLSLHAAYLHAATATATQIEDVDIQGHQRGPAGQLRRLQRMKRR